MYICINMRAYVSYLTHIRFAQLSTRPVVVFSFSVFACFLSQQQQREVVFAIASLVGARGSRPFIGEEAGRPH